ncbi:MAG: response regulator [Bacteroidia bacterium]
MKHIFKTKTTTTFSLFLLLAINIVYGFISMSYISKGSENDKVLFQGAEFLKSLRELQAEVLNIESSSRGYIITGDEGYLNNLELNEDNIKSELQFLPENVLQKENIENVTVLNKLVNDKIDNVNNVVRIYNEKGIKVATNEVEYGQGTRLMEDINEEINKLNASTKVIMNNTVSDGKNYVIKMRLFIIISTIGEMSIALLFLSFIYKDVDHRNILEEQLMQAKQKADKKVIIKEQFMANMSHEIRTPMNAIIGFTSLLQKTPMNEKQNEYVKTIKSAGENLLNLINDILDFSKIEAGMFRIENIPFSVPELMNSVYTMFLEKAKAKKLTMTLSVDEKIPQTILGDPTRLTQIIVNLLGNALKFTRNGEINISSKLLNSTEDNMLLEFTIQDTGIGISEDKLEEIFDRFNQGNVTTTREYGGTGLGLAIVKSLVTLQYGTLNVKSTHGKGSSFSFTITYKKCKDVVNTPPLSLSPKLKTEDAHVRVLLAEDNQMNQTLALTVLTDLGFKVDLAENGQVAYDMLKKNNNYDIVLMDLQMPVLDGYMAVRKIRNELNSTIPIIAMTAHVLPDEKEKCISSGMNDFITKPFKEEELHTIIIKNIYHTIPSSATNNNEAIPKINKRKPAELVDLSYLLELTKGKKSFILEMIHIFLEQNPIDLQVIEKAIAKSDLETVKAIAHKMKTSISFIGLTDKIGSDLDLMEHQENGITLDLIKKHFDNVKAVCEKAQAELIIYKNKI